MVIYEKNNKLNINFENDLNNPDIEIGKGEINVDGNNIVNGSGSSPLIVTFSGNTGASNAACDKTYAEVKAAYDSGRIVLFKYNSTVAIGVVPSKMFNEEQQIESFVAEIITTDGNTGVINNLYSAFCVLTEENEAIVYLSSVPLSSYIVI